MGWSGELIEQGIKNKKIEWKAIPTPLVKNITIVKKKERNVRAVFASQQSREQASYASQPSYSTSHLPPV